MLVRSRCVLCEHICFLGTYRTDEPELLPESRPDPSLLTVTTSHRDHECGHSSSLSHLVHCGHPTARRTRPPSSQPQGSFTSWPDTPPHPRKCARHSPVERWPCVLCPHREIRYVKRDIWRHSVVSYDILGRRHRLFHPPRPTDGRYRLYQGRLRPPGQEIRQFLWTSGVHRRKAVRSFIFLRCLS